MPDAPDAGVTLWGIERIGSAGGLGEQDRVSTIAPPTSCAAPNDSPSQTKATALAATGSSIATIPTRVAEMWRSAAATRRNVTIVPATTT